MARIFVDVSAFGQQWFKSIFSELSNCQRVRCSYVKLPKMVAEHGHAAAIEALRFYNIMGRMKRRDDADVSEAQRLYDYLCGVDCWVAERDCDDPHIFALAASMPFTFLFTADADIANCRNVIRRSIDNKFCQFSLITSGKNYKDHRATILS